MGILNLSPDSFSDGGLVTGPESASRRAAQLIAEGADIVDIGAVSTRPGAADIDEATERGRIIPVVERTRRDLPDAIISVDTWRSAIARECIAAGADMVNDISGGDFDEKMFETIAELDVPYVLMHTKGKPQVMQKDPQYENVVTDVVYHLSRRLDKLRLLGVSDIIIDPGFGFGKTLDHNYELLGKLQHFQIFELPVMVGLSRKSMISKALGCDTAETGNGTTVLHTIALMEGANILRVHEPLPAKEAIDLCNRCVEAGLTGNPKNIAL